MRTNQGLSKAYECEDTLQFLDETLASYKQMLNKENAISRSNRAFPRDSCADNSEKQDGNSSDSSRKEIAFKNWLQTVLTGSCSREVMDSGHSITCETSHYHTCGCDLQSYGFRRELDRTDVCRRKNGTFPASFFTECNLEKPDEKRFCEPLKSPCHSFSLKNNYESSTISSSYSFNEEEHENSADDVFGSIYDSKFCGFQYEIGKSESGACKTRNGSWSDSGYCCDKSDSDNSRFSSLSFGDSQKLKNDDNIDSFSSEYLKQTNDQMIEKKIAELSETIQRLSFNGDLKDAGELNEQVFDTEFYTAEELDILQELLKNPENSHETTKELSDIGRDISSNGWKRRHAKAKQTIGQFFRKFVGGIRKFSSEKQNSKTGRTAARYSMDSCREVSLKLGKRSKTRNRSRSLSPFLKNCRSSSVKTPKKKFSLSKRDNKKIHRASSYSSLFGRRGSLFSHYEQNDNLQRARRSVSFNTLHTQGLDFFYEEPKIKFVDQQSESMTFIDVIDYCYSCRMCSCDGCEQICPCEQSTDLSFHLKNEDYVTEQQLVPPLSINVSEERSAFTRRITKLRDSF